jgi:HD-GYP domain-containing protein (c-di-GMP phosphodiesterase class II)
MLKQIALSDLELGMFVHKMQGSWFNHPFWKSKFLVEDEQSLRTLKTSQLDGVVIDTAKGKDITPAPRPVADKRSHAGTAPSARLNAIKSRKSVDRRHDEPVSTATEVRAAEAIAERAKEKVHKAFLETRLGKALDVRAVEPVVSDVLASVRRNPQAFGGLMRCKLRNELTYHHALAVSALMISLARKMQLTENQVLEAGLAGLLLDLGVNYLPQNLDPPNGDFRNADPKIWQQHVMLGYRALQSDDCLSPAVLDACLQHHERIDGSGFPQGLAQDEIALIARMAAICDTFDHLLTRTEASPALDPGAAIQRLIDSEGAFDPEILQMFIESVGLFPAGTFVRLRSNKLAMVIDLDPRDSTKPIVQAFYDLTSGDRVIPHRINLAANAGQDDIIGIADLTGLGLPDDEQLRELVFLSAYKPTQG